MNGNQVRNLLEELKKTVQIVERFAGNESIPEIEKDIVLSKLRNMYELIRFDQTQGTEIKEQVETRPEKESRPLVEEFKEIHPPTELEKADEIEWEPEAEPEKTMDVPIPIHVEPEPANDVKTEPAREIIKEKVESEKPVSHTKTPSSAKKEILAEKFQKQSFLNEALAQYQNMMDLSKKLQNQPINDISLAINFNEKFLFIKELFSNNSALYQTTMEKINHAGNFNEAIRYLDEHFSWDFNDPQVQKLLELIRRRYHNQ